jgi:hypothetical protein
MRKTLFFLLWQLDMSNFQDRKRQTSEFDE